MRQIRYPDLYDKQLRSEAQEILDLMLAVESAEFDEHAIKLVTDFAQKLHDMKEAAKAAIDFVENTMTVQSDPPSTVSFIEGMKFKGFYLRAKRALGITENS